MRKTTSHCDSHQYFSKSRPRSKLSTATPYALSTLCVALELYNKFPLVPLLSHFVHPLHRPKQCYGNQQYTQRSSRVRISITTTARWHTLFWTLHCGTHRAESIGHKLVILRQRTLHFAPGTCQGLSADHVAAQAPTWFRSDCDRVCRVYLLYPLSTIFYTTTTNRTTEQQQQCVLWRTRHTSTQTIAAMLYAGNTDATMPLLEACAHMLRKGIPKLLVWSRGDQMLNRQRLQSRETLSLLVDESINSSL